MAEISQCEVDLWLHSAGKEMARCVREALHRVWNKNGEGMSSTHVPLCPHKHTKHGTGFPTVSPSRGLDVKRNCDHGEQNKKLENYGYI